LGEAARFVDTLKPPGDTEQREKGLIPWLENPKQCECGEYCIATTG